jgi:hypothetical protein
MFINLIKDKHQIFVSKSKLRREITNTFYADNLILLQKPAYVGWIEKGPNQPGFQKILAEKIEENRRTSFFSVPIFMMKT